MINYIKSLFKSSPQPKYLAVPESSGNYSIYELSNDTFDYTLIRDVNVNKQEIETRIKNLERAPIEIYVTQSRE